MYLKGFWDNLWYTRCICYPGFRLTVMLKGNYVLPKDWQFGIWVFDWEYLILWFQHILQINARIHLINRKGTLLLVPCVKVSTMWQKKVCTLIFFLIINQFINADFFFLVWLKQTFILCNGCVWATCTVSFLFFLFFFGLISSRIHTL